MHVRHLGIAPIAAVSLASGASAACLPDGPVAQAFTLRDSVERATGLVVLTGTLIQMPPYSPKNLTSIKRTCEAATLRSGRRVYVLKGTLDAALPRIALPKDRKEPLFLLITVPDLTGILPKSDGPKAPLGYVLVSRDETNAYVYRAYDVVPNDLQLATDLGAALEGRISPMLRADLIKREVTITVAEGAGAVVDRSTSPMATPSSNSP